MQEPASKALAVLFVMAAARMMSIMRTVTSFDINRYLGQWYEIARLDQQRAATP
jgi:lipocalin